MKTSFDHERLNVYQEAIRCRINSGRYAVTVTTSAGTAKSALDTFNVTDSTHHGFIGIAPNRRYLAHSDKSAYYGVGLWHNDNYELFNQGAITEADLDNLKKRGANFISFYPTLLETPGSGLGRYDQNRCGRMDQLFDWCERRDMKISWNVLFHSHVSQATWVNPRYRQNPYRLISSARDFFGSEEAWQYQQKLFRFIIARWGYSRALWNGFHKPAIIGECGWDHTYYEPGTPGYLAMYHNALWVSLSNGLCATPFWWRHEEQINDCVVNNQMLFFSRFVADIDFANLELQPAEITAGSCDAWAMKSDTLVFGWIVHPGAGVASESFTIAGLRDGRYEVRLYKTWQGRYLAPQTISARNGRLVCTIPELKTTEGHASNMGDDVAFRIVLTIPRMPMPGATCKRGLTGISTRSRTRTRGGIRHS